MGTITYAQCLKQCRQMAKAQNIEFRRSKTIGKINGLACYELVSGIHTGTLHQGCLDTIYTTLLHGGQANK